MAQAGDVERERFGFPVRRAAGVQEDRSLPVLTGGVS
jgi:hypothetical protein